MLSMQLPKKWEIVKKKVSYEEEVKPPPEKKKPTPPPPKEQFEVKEPVRKAIEENKRTRPQKAADVARKKGATKSQAAHAAALCVRQAKHPVEKQAAAAADIVTECLNTTPQEAGEIAAEVADDVGAPEEVIQKVAAQAAAAAVIKEGGTPVEAAEVAVEVAAAAGAPDEVVAEIAATVITDNGGSPPEAAKAAAKA